MHLKHNSITKYLICVVLLSLLVCLFSSEASSQEIVDKTIATVSDGSSEPELITYSDLLWQLSLEPDTPLTPPTSDDLNRALQTLINLRLFVLEAKRLPSAEPTEKELSDEIERILKGFSSSAEFEKRLRIVGFDSISDDNFQRMMRQRVAIEKYINFRFRSFVIVTAEEELRFYREIYTPDFRQRNPGLLLPNISEVRPAINRILTERKIEEDIQTFLDDAKRRAEIIVLFEVI